MLTRVFSAIQDVDAVGVEVEVNSGHGTPQIVVVEPIFASTMKALEASQNR